MTPEYELAVAFLGSHPRQAALVLERLPGAERVAVLRAMPTDVATPALREMARQTAADSLARLDPTEAARLAVEFMPDQAADVLRRVSSDQRDRILGELPTVVRERVERVLRYPDDSAGALMDPSILDLPDDISVADAQERVRGAMHDLLYYLYVVDRARHLVGVLDIPELMTARPTDQLRAVMHTPVDTLSAWASPSVIRRDPGWRSYHAMPVVDDRGRLLGAIRYQTLRRLEQDAAGGGPPPAAMTALALGELFHLGVTGLIGSLVSAASPQRTALRPSRTEHHEGGEVRNA